MVSLDQLDTAVAKTLTQTSISWRDAWKEGMEHPYSISQINRHMTNQCSLLVEAKEIIMMYVFIKIDATRRVTFQCSTT